MGYRGEQQQWGNMLSEENAVMQRLDSFVMRKRNNKAMLTHLVVSARAAQVLLVLAALLFPVIGYCDSGNGVLKNLFNSKGKNMKDVAVKVAELPELNNINVQGLDFSPDGEHLAVRSAYQTINIWDWRGGRIVHSMEKAQGANDGLTTEPLRFSPNGKLFIAGHSRADGDVVARIWNTDTWEIVHDIIDPIGGSGCNALGFTQDGKSLIRVLDRMPNISGDTLIVYDTTTWQPVWGLRTVPFYTYNLAISPNAKFIALGGGVRNPRDWPFNTPIPTFGNPPLPNMSLIAIIDMEQRTIVRTIQSEGRMGRGSPLAWSPDGAYITMGSVGRLEIFDAQSGKLLIEAPFGAGRKSLRYTPDGKYLIEGDANDKKTGWGKIWDGQHRELLQEITGNVGSLAVSRNSRYLATGVDGKTIIWQLK